MVAPETIEAYNRTRATRDLSLVCHAPSVSINFEQNGNATACCYNRSHVLGSWPRQSLREMWFGEPAQELRARIQAGDLGGGCKVCRIQLEAGNFHGTRARHFDHLAEPPPAAAGAERALGMPRLMEFELSNTCNLECQMCHGYFSSSIRRNREKLPPLQHPYDAGFVAELAEFIPHLAEAKFLGGEPFLIDVYYAIWEKIRELNPELLVQITTNGTVLTRRVRALLEDMRCGIVVSIDSFDAENYERIRQNARFDRVMENVAWLRDYARRKQTWLSFAVCPMVQNWHELPGIVERCNALGSSVCFNTVFEPEECSLRFVAAELLERIVARQRRVELPEATPQQRGNRNGFADLTHQLEHWLADVRRQEALPDPLAGRVARELERHAERLRGWRLAGDASSRALADGLLALLRYRLGLAAGPRASDADSERAWLRERIDAKLALLAEFTALRSELGRRAFVERLFEAYAELDTRLCDGVPDPDYARKLKELTPFLLQHPRFDVIADELPWSDPAQLLRMPRHLDDDGLRRVYRDGYA